jgi:hypothetical protein
MPRTKSNPSKDFHKQIRRLLDDGKFDQIIQSIRTFAESGVTILPDTIANVLANFYNIASITDNTQEIVDYLLSLISEKDYTELVYTSLIKIYAECEPMFLKYYEMMKKNDVPVKRRTLAPIFEFSPTLSFIFFNEAKVQGVSLAVEDYCNILMNLTRECHNFHRSMVVEDMVKSVKGPISVEDVHHLQTCLTNLDGPVETPAPFTLSKKEKDKMLEKMKIYVGHFYGKNPRVLGTITKAMGIFQKMKYDTVIDGANVGFFKRGVLSGKKICFNQLFNLGNQLTTIGHNPLIILHQHHVDTATVEEKEMLKINKVPMFIVPKGGDDDWFWLYAALTNTKSLLVTNDEMRNHFHYMNFDSEFIDWKTTHVVRYDMNDSKFTLNFPDTVLKDMVIDRSTRTIKVCDTLGEWTAVTF